MRSGKNRKEIISVSIGGVSYKIKSSNSKEYISRIADEADGAIKRLIDLDPSLSVSQATVLAIMNFADALHKQSDELEKLKKSVGEIEDEKKEALQKLEIQRENFFEIKKELLELKKINKQLEEKIETLNYQTETEEESEDGSELKKLSEQEQPDEEYMVEDFLEEVKNPFPPDDSKEEKPQEDSSKEDDEALDTTYRQQSFDE